MRKPTIIELDRACYRANWQQVIINGGPPCFAFEESDGKFCLRAERWAGHTDKDKWPQRHRFVSLAALIDQVRADAKGEL
jgi:hypothetical protein